MKIDLEAMNASVKDKLPGHLGMELVSLEDGRAVATMPVDSRHHQPYGILHGGASVALAETVASMGGWYLAHRDNKVVVGLEINANHLKKVRSGILSAEAKILHRGRSTQVWEIRIKDEKNILVCISRCTLAVIDAPSGG